MRQSHFNTADGHKFADRLTKDRFFSIVHTSGPILDQMLCRRARWQLRPLHHPLTRRFASTAPAGGEVREGKSAQAPSRKGRGQKKCDDYLARLPVPGAFEAQFAHVGGVGVEGFQQFGAIAFHQFGASRFRVRGGECAPDGGHGFCLFARLGDGGGI